MVDNSQGILDDAKNKLEQKKTQFVDGVNEEKESGTSFRDIINKTKKRIFGEPKVPFENELTKSEQLDNIRTKLAESKTGRARLRQTKKQEAKAKLQEVDKQNLRKAGLEPLEEPILGERPQGAVKGVKKPPRTIEEKSSQGIASSQDENLPDDEEILKNKREEDEIKGK